MGLIKAGASAGGWARKPGERGRLLFNCEPLELAGRGEMQTRAWLEMELGCVVSH